MDPEHESEIPALNRCAHCERKFEPLQEFVGIVIGRTRPLFCNKHCMEMWFESLRAEVER